MIKKYALINDVTQIVENVIMWDGVRPYSAPVGVTMLNVDGINPVGIGMLYNGTDFEFINGEDIPGE